MMRTAIIILSWNSKQLIGDCLKGLIRYENCQVYVVDNGSEDGSAEYIALRYPQVKLIRSPMNLGFASGNNLGIKQALKDGCDAVLLLNNDTIIDEPFVLPCVSILESNSDIGIVGPIIVEGNRPEIIQCRGGNISLWNLDFSYLGMGEKYVRKELHESVGYVLGAAILIRKEVFEKIGLLDPEYYPAYVEEADFCYRARFAGYDSVVSAATRVRHIGDQSSGSYENSFRRFTANRFLFGLKHLGFARFFIAAQIIVWKITIKKLIQRLS